MFEKFTDRARKVMQLANKNSNLQFTGTEHVLLAFLQESSGVAANVLTRLGVTLDRVKKEVKPSAERSVDSTLTPTGTVRTAIQFAHEEAAALGHAYIGTEHLLLGIVRASDGNACQILYTLGVSPESVREMTMFLLGLTSVEVDKLSEIEKIVNSHTEPSKALEEIRNVFNR